jgi:hypothetical protein
MGWLGRLDQLQDYLCVLENLGHGKARALSIDVAAQSAQAR